MNRINRNIALGSSFAFGLAAGMWVCPWISHAEVRDVVYVGATGTGTVFVPFTPVAPPSLYRPFVPEVDTATSVKYNGGPEANPYLAVDNVNAVAAQQDKPITYVGISKGAQVTTEHEKQNTDPTAEYVNIGSPDRRGGGISRAFNLSSPYQEPTHNVTEVYAEGDAVADFPDRPLNLFATGESLARWAWGPHAHYGDGSEDDVLPRIDEAEIEVRDNLDADGKPNGTTTTSVRIPVNKLYMLDPLRDTEFTLTGNDRITREVEKVLTPVVKAGWSRNDKKGGDELSGRSDTDRESVRGAERNAAGGDSGAADAD